MINRKLRSVVGAAALAVWLLTGPAIALLPGEVPNEPPERIVSVCPERLMPSTIARLEAQQPGILRPRQKYATVARLALGWCRGDNQTSLSCVDATELPGSEMEIIVPSLKSTSRTDVDVDGGIMYDAAIRIRQESCRILACDEFEKEHPGFCTKLSSVWLMKSFCRLPNCWSNGEWSPNQPVDCRRRIPETDGGAEWVGCYVMSATEAVGTQCLETNCEVISGEDVESL